MRQWSNHKRVRELAREGGMRRQLVELVPSIRVVVSSCVNGGRCGRLGHRMALVGGLAVKCRFESGLFRHLGNGWRRRRRRARRLRGRRRKGKDTIVGTLRDGIAGGERGEVSIGLGHQHQPLTVHLRPDDTQQDG